MDIGKLITKLDNMDKQSKDKNKEQVKTMLFDEIIKLETKILTLEKQLDKTLNQMNMLKELEDNSQSISFLLKQNEELTNDNIHLVKKLHTANDIIMQILLDEVTNNNDIYLA